MMLQCSECDRRAVQRITSMDRDYFRCVDHIALSWSEGVKVWNLHLDRPAAVLTIDPQNINWFLKWRSLEYGE